MEDLIFQAKLAEATERYENMFWFVKRIMEETEVLNNEIKNLITVAFNNLMHQRVCEWRVIADIEVKELNFGRIEKASLVREYRKMIETRITEICTEILNFIDIWMKNPNEIEIKIFLLKLKEKVYKNLAIFQTHELNIEIYGEDSRDKQNKAQEEAFKVTTTELSPVDPIRLSSALSLAVFTYEIYNDSKKALHIAKEAFSSAIPQIESVSDENFKDVSLILSLLRDNITLWSNEELYEINK